VPDSAPDDTAGGSPDSAPDGTVGGSHISMPDSAPDGTVGGSHISVPDTLMTRCRGHFNVAMSQVLQCGTTFSRASARSVVHQPIYTYCHGILCNDSGSALAAKSSGAVFALALLLLCSCWLQHSPSIVSVMLSFLSISAYVTMNTIEWDIVFTPVEAVHMQAVILISVCFFVLFLQGGYVIWQAVQRDCALPGNDVCNTCTPTEGFYVILMIAASSVMRFVEPLLRETEEPRASQRSAPDHAFNICAIITTAALIMSALLLQTFAAFGRLGNTASLLVPVPYIVMIPCITIVRTTARDELIGDHVWRNFTRCSSVAVHAFCIFWPVVLYTTDHIDEPQMLMTFIGNVCIMIATQLVICIVDPSAVSSLRTPRMQLL
jgi:hypothetical protein